MVIVDSCVWIEASRDKVDSLLKTTLRNLLKESEAAFCGPVKLEVLGPLTRERRKSTSLYFSVIPYIHSSEQLWESAKILSWKLRDSGLTVPWNDILISAIALEKNYRVYSLDAHFIDIARITGMRLYQPGENGQYTPDTA